jgi:hypothetical protein
MVLLAAIGQVELVGGIAPSLDQLFDGGPQPIVHDLSVILGRIDDRAANQKNEPGQKREIFHKDLKCLLAMGIGQTLKL